jgi:hypothetical protein
VITFECTALLEESIEVKVVYVGNPGDNSEDQDLDTVEVGPIEVGISTAELGGKPNLAIINPELLREVWPRCVAQEFPFFSSDPLPSAGYGNSVDRVVSGARVCKGRCSGVPERYLETKKNFIFRSGITSTTDTRTKR